MPAPESTGAPVRDVPPIFVDGIGPPLQQIEEDYLELIAEADEGSPYATKHRVCARDVLALIAEVRRLRG